MWLLNILRSKPCRTLIVVLTITSIITLNQRNTVVLGHNLQLALPIIGFSCSLINGSAFDYFIRFVILEAGIHIPKNTLGDTPINVRPNGKLQGFPSGHTAAAFFSASYIARECVQKNPLIQLYILTNAAYVGYSRVEGDKHTFTQVFFGFLLGLFVDIAYRRKKNIRVQFLFRSTK